MLGEIVKGRNIKGLRNQGAKIWGLIFDNNTTPFLQKGFSKNCKIFQNSFFYMGYSQKAVLIL